MNQKNRESVFFFIRSLPQGFWTQTQLYNLTKNTNPWLKPRKNEPKKQRISFFFLRNLPQGFWNQQIQDVPNSCQNPTEINQKKIPKKNYFSLISLSSLERWGNACISGGGGGGLGETPGGAVEVVANEEGGGGLGSGRHQFGQWVLLENVVVFWELMWSVFCR